MRKTVGTMLVVITFGIIINIFTSCEKNNFETYNISINNEYFEDIDSVYIGDTYYGKIKRGDNSQGKTIIKGTHIFKALSTSGLKFNAKIHVTGNHEHIHFFFTNQGKLTER